MKHCSIAPPVVKDSTVCLEEKLGCFCSFCWWNLSFWSCCFSVYSKQNHLHLFLNIHSLHNTSKYSFTFTRKPNRHFPDIRFIGELLLWKRLNKSINPQSIDKLKGYLVNKIYEVDPQNMNPQYFGNNCCNLSWKNTKYSPVLTSLLKTFSGLLSCFSANWISLGLVEQSNMQYDDITLVWRTS